MKIKLIAHNGVSVEILVIRIKKAEAISLGETRLLVVSWTGVTGHCWNFFGLNPHNRLELHNAFRKTYV